MKQCCFALFLVLICCQGRLNAQHSGTNLWGELPGAGQVLAVNPDLLMHQPAARKIDFDSLDMAFTGNWPAGQSFSISSSQTGDTLFVGEGGMLRVLDVTNPYIPVQLAEIRARAIIDHSYYDAASSRLYLAAYFSGIEVWSLEDFNNPHRLCRIPTNSYPRGGVFGRDNYVFIATVADGFYVADISDPGNPQMVAHCVIPGSTLIWDSDFQGDFAYLAAGSGGMRVIDFSDPLDPVVAGVFTGMTGGIRARDTLVYIASSTLGFRILNVKDPGSITVAGNCPLPGSPSRVTLAGDFAYVANSTTADGGGVNVVDISDPSSPFLVTTYPGFQTFIAGHGDVIGATGGTEGCLILDVSDPSQPLEAFAWPLAGFLYQIAVEGDLGFTGSNGFRVFDLSDKTNPVQIGFHETLGELAAVSDTLAVFIPKSMTANNPVHIMNITDPQNPSKLGQYMAPVMTWDVALKDHYAFIACWWDGVRVVDFSNPGNPVLKARRFGWSSGAVPGVDFCYVQALDIYGDYLYLVDYLPFPEEDTKGLYIFDISNPEDPVFVSRFASLVSSGQDIRAFGDYVYIADGNGGMEVIDVSDPILPFTAGYCSLPDGATGIDISWPFVFLSDYILGGVQVVDVTIPQFPFVTAYYKPSGVFALGVTVDNNYVFAGDGVAGFQIYDLLTATQVKGNYGISASGYAIYPNPTTGKFKLHLARQNDAGRAGGRVTGKVEEIRIELVDLNGRLVKVLTEGTSAPEELEFDISQVPAGVYFVRIINNNGVQVRKIIRP